MTYTVYALEGTSITIGSTVIRTIQGDITNVDSVTAVVNAANRSLLGGGIAITCGEMKAETL